MSRTRPTRGVRERRPHAQDHSGRWRSAPPRSSSPPRRMRARSAAGAVRSHRPARAADPTGPSLRVKALRPTRAAARRPPDSRSSATDTSWTATAPPTSGMDRTYRGLPVVGGDLVVHQGPAAPGAGSARPCTSAARPRHHPEGHGATARRAGPRHRRRRRPGHRQPARPTGAPRLVVDAIRATPRLAWEVISGGGAPTAPRAGWRRTSTPGPARCSAARRRSQTVDGTGKSLYSGTVPLQVTQSGSTYQLKDPTRGNTYTTDMNNKPRTRSCARSSATAARPGTPVHQHRRPRSATAPPATGRRPAWTRSTAPT